MLSLVIPVYRNEGNIPDLLKALENLQTQIPEEMEVVFVVDGSPDRCYEMLREELRIKPFASKLVLLSRNFGAFQAIRIGLQHGTGVRFAVMAADLQEPPELVAKMSAILRERDIDVVVGSRIQRNDPPLAKLASTIFWNLYRKFVMPEIPEGGIDIFACNKEFRDVLLTLEERHSSLIAQIFWLGFRRETVAYERLKREHGRSAWTFRKKLTYLLDSVFSFTDLPIKILIRLGIAGTVASTTLGLAVLLARWSGSLTVPGYAATILTILFFGSINILGIGILGSYTWRTYENTKQRPLAIPMRTHHYGRKDE